MLAAGSRQNASSDELGGLGTLPDERRRPARHAEPDRRLRPAEVQPRRDRRVRVRLQPVRRHAGRLERHAWSMRSPSPARTSIRGSFSGYFRDDKFIAKDFVQDRVLPYQDQQFSATFGGPIMKDRVHFFANYEYEREPQTFSFSSPYPSFNLDQSGTRTEHKGGGRLDFQFSPTTHLTVRGNKSLVDMPYDARYTGGSTRHPVVGHHDRPAQHRPQRRSHAGAEPAAVQRNPRQATPGYYWIQDSIVAWPDHPYPGLDLRHADHQAAQLHDRPGPHLLARRRAAEHLVGPRQPDARRIDKAGRHDLKVGGEGFYQKNPVFLCIRCMGVYDARAARSRRTSSSCSRSGTTSRRGTSPRCRRSSGATRWASARCSNRRRSAGCPAGSRTTGGSGRTLTLNLGVRYDLEDGVYAEDVELEPLDQGGPAERHEQLAPRLGAPTVSTNARSFAAGSDATSRIPARTRRTGRSSTPTRSSRRSSTTAAPISRPTRSTVRSPTFEQVADHALHRVVGAELPAAQHADLVRRRGRRDPLQQPGVGRRPASVRVDDGARGRLRLQRPTARAL